MKISIKGTNIKLTESIKKWVRKKLLHLARFDKTLSNKDILPSGKKDETVDVWVEVGKTKTAQKKGDIFRAEGQMRLKGKSIRVSTITKNLKTAISQMSAKLARKIKQIKQKTRSSKKFDESKKQG